MKRLIIATIVLIVLCSAAVIYSQEKPAYGPQVVLVVHKSTNGIMEVVPATKVWFRIGPISPETHPAPLPEGTNMLCHAYDLHSGNGTYLALKCGMDDYLVQAVGINPEK